MTEATEYHSFSDEAVSAALEAARRPHEGKDLRAIGSVTVLDNSLSTLAECISLTVGNGQVCLELPLGLGSVCLPIPVSFPNGTAAQACLRICTTFGVPTGVCVQVVIAGVSVVEQCFGFGC